MIGILGGTFDPIHLGHISVAQQLKTQLPLSQVDFMPCKMPPHRDTPTASEKDRVAMIEIAIQAYPDLHCNTVELERNAPSYTIDTVKILRKRHPTTQIALLIGQDAFQQFNTWLDYAAILEFVHIVVLNRPHANTDIPDWMMDLFSLHRVAEKDALEEDLVGSIYCATIDPIDISSTDVRATIAHQRDLKDLLPESVIAYIDQHRLYQQA